MVSLPITEAELRSAPIPKHVFLPRGMIVPGEQALLYLIGRDVWTGAGEIVDAGAFCGASAYALAAGLHDGASDTRRDGRIWSYDLFAANDAYTRDYIQTAFYAFTDPAGAIKFCKREVAFGESFLDIFEFQTQRYASHIRAFPGSILDHAWDGSDIEVLFIDVAKTLEIQQHLFRSFLPKLIPGGILLQQDFHHAWHPYIHVAMEYLAPYFRITHPHVGATRAYQLIDRIPSTALDRVTRHDFAPDEAIGLMRRCIESSDRPTRPLLTVALVRLLGEYQHDAALVREIESFVDQWRDLPGVDRLCNELRAAAGPVAVATLDRLGR